MAWKLAQGFGCTRSIPSQYRVQASKVYVSKQEYKLVHQVLYDKHIANVIRLHTVFLVNQTLLLENIDLRGTTDANQIFNKLYGSSSLIGLTHVMHKFNHDLLVNSKQLTSIKLSILVIYKIKQVFPYTNYHMQHFLNQPNTNQFISSTLQTNISELREYFLQKKANSSDKRYMKTRAKS